MRDKRTRANIQRRGRKINVTGRIVCYAAQGCPGNKAKHLWPRTYHNEQCTLWKNGTEDPWSSLHTAKRTFSDVQWFIMQFGTVLVPLACATARWVKSWSLGKRRLLKDKMYFDSLQNFIFVLINCFVHLFLNYNDKLLLVPAAQMWRFAALPCRHSPRGPSLLHSPWKLRFLRSLERNIAMMVKGKAMH